MTDAGNEDELNKHVRMFRAHLARRTHPTKAGKERPFTKKWGVAVFKVLLRRQPEPVSSPELIDEAIAELNERPSQRTNAETRVSEAIGPSGWLVRQIPLFYKNDDFTKGLTRYELTRFPTDSAGNTTAMRLAPAPLEGQVVQDKVGASPADPAAALHRIGTRKPLIYENLPPPIYSHFVERRAQYDALRDALGGRSGVVAVVGLGGMGKTCLVRELAYRCINKLEPRPHFDAVVWISDGARPGWTKLNEVLDVIATTLNLSDVTRLVDQAKLFQIQQLLKQKTVLLIIDNFDTITDTSLVEWISTVPEPSKVVLTTRPDSQLLPKHARRIDDLKWAEEDITAFVEPKAIRLGLSVGALAPLVKATGGNPKAIETALGVFDEYGRPLTEIISDLPDATGDLLEDIFGKCWEPMERDARAVLLAMNLFPYGAGDGALSAVSGVDGGAFAKSLRALIRLQLVNVVRVNIEAPPHYIPNSLVAAFVSAQAAIHSDLHVAARDRWVKYWASVADGIGFCPGDLPRLDILDGRGMRETVRFAIDWTYKHGMYAETIRIAKGARYYYYVRGHWSEKPSIHEVRALAARALGDPVEEFDALTYHINIAAKQNNPQEFQRHRPRLDELVPKVKRHKALLVSFRHAVALHLLCLGQLTEAEKVWKENLKSSQSIDADAYSTNLRWLAVCLHRQQRLPEAKAGYAEALRHAKDHGFMRAEVAIELRLLHLHLDEQEPEPSLVEERLPALEALVLKVKDRLYEAELQELACRLAKVRGDPDKATKHQIAAHEVLKGLGRNTPSG